MPVTLLSSRVIDRLSLMQYLLIFERGSRTSENKSKLYVVMKAHYSFIFLNNEPKIRNYVKNTLGQIS